MSRQEKTLPFYADFKIQIYVYLYLWKNSLIVTILGYNFKAIIQEKNDLQIL